MKASEFSFADMAALELLPAVLNSRHFLHQPEPEAGYVAAARFVYGQADALAAERERRNNLRDHELETLRTRAERAEASNSILLNMGEDGKFAVRVALSEIWEALGAKHQTQAMTIIRALLAAAEKLP